MTARNHGQVLRATLLILLLGIAGGCGPRQAARPESVAPATAAGVACIQRQAIHADAELSRIVRLDELDRLLAGRGIDPSTVDRIAVVIHAADSESPTLIMSIVPGGTRPPSAGPSGGMEQVVLASGLIVLGPEVGVRRVQVAEASPDTTFFRQARVAELSLPTPDAVAPIALYLAVPPDIRDAQATVVELASDALDMAGLGPVATLLARLGTARAGSMEIARTPEGLPIRVRAVLRDEQAAQFVSGALQLLEGIGGLAAMQGARSSSERDAFTACLKTMEVARQGSRVDVPLVLPRAAAP